MMISKLSNPAIYPACVSGASSIVGMLQLYVLWPLCKLIASANSASQILFAAGSLLLLSFARRQSKPIASSCRSLIGKPMA